MLIRVYTEFDICGTDEIRRPEFIITRRDLFTVNALQKATSARDI